MDCYTCRYANEYLLGYWYPYFNPTCSKGYPLGCLCGEYEMIGRNSR